MTTQPSDLAKIVAGTFVQDSFGKAKENPVYAWVQHELRDGALRSSVDEFLKTQPELVDPGLLIVEHIGENLIECVVPCKMSDHESRSTFVSEVRFNINPVTGQAARKLS